jgi:conjugative transfer signal peptidase TraF
LRNRSPGPSDLQIRFRRALRTVLFLCLPFVLLYAAFRIFGIRPNFTSSLEPGLYIVGTGPAANLVEFCPVGEAAALSLSRAYRMRGGSCPDGSTPLMKPVVAVPGDDVEVAQDGIRVNGRLILNSAARFRDHRGRPLHPWPYGEYRVLPETLWVVSDFNPSSYDSRYFGPIRASLVRERLRPLWTFPTKMPAP